MSTVVEPLNEQELRQAGCNVFSASGSFGKQKYWTAMFKGNEVGSFDNEVDAWDAARLHKECSDSRAAAEVALRLVAANIPAHLQNVIIDDLKPQSDSEREAIQSTFRFLGGSPCGQRDLALYGRIEFVERVAAAIVQANVEHGSRWATSLEVGRSVYQPELEGALLGAPLLAAHMADLLTPHGAREVAIAARLVWLLEARRARKTPTILVAGGTAELLKALLGEKPFAALVPKSAY